MRILALDSSRLVASVAVVEDGAVDDQVIAEYTVNYKKTHSQTFPMLDEIVKMTELDLHTVDAIAVAGEARIVAGTSYMVPQRPRDLDLRLRNR